MTEGELTAHTIAERGKALETGRRHEWMDDETGCPVWVTPESLVAFDGAFSSEYDEMLERFIAHLASRLDTLEAERDEALKYKGGALIMSHQLKAQELELAALRAELDR